MKPIKKYQKKNLILLIVKRRNHFYGNIGILLMEKKHPILLNYA